MIANSLFALLILTWHVKADKLKDMCRAASGVYHRRSCYSYKTTDKTWFDAMDDCMNLMPGFLGHLAHATDSEVLTIFKQMASAYSGSAFIGTRHDASVLVPTGTDFKTGKDAIDKTNFLPIPVNNLFVVQSITEEDPLIEQTGWALAYDRLDSGHPRIINAMMTNARHYFCQTKNAPPTKQYNCPSGMKNYLQFIQCDGISGRYTNYVTHFQKFDVISILDGQLYSLAGNQKSGYSITIDGQGRRYQSSYMIQNHTVSTSIECLKVCKKHGQCLGFNHNPSIRQCELSAWRLVDAKIGQYVVEEGWTYYESW